MTRLTWENVCSEAARGANPERPLTHLLDLSERGLAVKATRTCSVDGCSKPRKTRGLCGTHYLRLWRMGEVERAPLASGYHPVGEAHPNWQGSEICYGQAHKRVRVVRGQAPAHPCQHCGGKAAEWAYDRTDPDERRDERNRPYSTDPARYLPLCRGCHWRLDHPEGKPRRGGGESDAARI